MEVKVLGAVDGATVLWILLAVVLVFFLLWFVLRTRGLEEEGSAVSQASAEDDLKVIEGIGPKLEQVLKEAGIKTYRDLAAKSAEEIRALLDAAGVARISNPQTWPEQAHLASEGRWEELKQLQGRLKGGLRV